MSKKTGRCNRCGKNIEESKHELYINATDKCGMVVIRQKFVLCDDCSMNFAGFMLNGNTKHE